MSKHASGFDLRNGLRTVGDLRHMFFDHINDVIMSAMASQMTSLTIVYSNIHSCTDQRKHQSSASLAFVRGTRRWPVNSPHKGPVTRKKSSHFMTSSYDLRSWDTSIVKLFYHVPSSIASLVRFKVSTFSINAQWIVQSLIQEFMRVTRKSSSNWRYPTKNMPVDGIVLYWSKCYIYILYNICIQILICYQRVRTLCEDSGLSPSISHTQPQPSNWKRMHDFLIKFWFLDFMMLPCMETPSVLLALCVINKQWNIRWFIDA